ncbi:hypothetical protein FRB94_010503 [Tulasnella sp. JGI-2019a]|nr:hypothetical protein FRB93_008396 [Tulasnella sp. JGI-2019a]KAG8993635.1 hypothetical protein FRB94_010503 [Tulasnella sp. JGI-2019a]KAG9027981.1 hypothetical protein FRB95_006987 [Tulasnella sp. JGI-2019a]
MAPVETITAPWHVMAADFFYSHPIIATLLAIIGVYSVAAKALSLLDLLFQVFLKPGRSLKKFGAKQGVWAVVTGCTDGIGREFALQLAKAGFNVVLASRTQEKLTALASEIESQHKVQTKTCAMDFAKKDNEAGYASFEAALSGLKIGVLVNNVGKSHDIPTYFDETSNKEIDDILEVNIHATLRVTKMILPFMLKRKSGLILNLGSFAGFIPSPMLATYSGSKAFISAWSQALADEYGSRNITIQNLNTYFVVSNMSKIRRSSMTTPMPREYVKSVLSKIGVPCGSISTTATSTPYWSHAIMEWVITKADVMSYLIRFSHNLHIDIRKRALKKRAREAEVLKED